LNTIPASTILVWIRLDLEIASFRVISDNNF
jgi:hypothetical protein